MKSETEILEDILKFSAGTYELHKKMADELKLLNKNFSQLIKLIKEEKKNNPELKM